MFVVWHASTNTTAACALNGDAAIGDRSAPTAEPKKKRRRYPPDRYSDVSQLAKERESFEFDETRVREEANRLEKEFEKKRSESSMQTQRFCGWKNGKKYFKDGTIVITQKGMALTEFRKKTEFMVKVNAALSWPLRRERPKLEQVDQLLSDQDVSDLRETFFKSDGSLAEDAVCLINHCRRIAFKNSEWNEKQLKDKRYQVKCEESAHTEIKCFDFDSMLTACPHNDFHMHSFICALKLYTDSEHGRTKREFNFQSQEGV